MTLLNLTSMPSSTTAMASVHRTVNAGRNFTSRDYLVPNVKVNCQAGLPDGLIVCGGRSGMLTCSCAELGHMGTHSALLVWRGPGDLGTKPSGIAGHGSRLEFAVYAAPFLPWRKIQRAQDKDFNTPEAFPARHEPRPPVLTSSSSFPSSLRLSFPSLSPAPLSGHHHRSGTATTQFPGLTAPIRSRAGLRRPCRSEPRRPTCRWSRGQAQPEGL